MKETLKELREKEKALQLEYDAAYKLFSERNEALSLARENMEKARRRLRENQREQVSLLRGSI